MLQRTSRRGTHLLRTSSSDSDSQRFRPNTDRSLKVGDCRSPREPASVNQKKLGTRIADLESQLGQAQEELKVLKHQVSSAEDAKREAQQQLKKKAKKPPVPEADDMGEKRSSSEISDPQKRSSKNVDEGSDVAQNETDVFEVPMEKKAVDANERLNVPTKPDKPLFHDLELKDAEISMLKAKLLEKENELEVLGKENDNLKNKLNEASSDLSSAETKEEEMSQRISLLTEELHASKSNAALLVDEVNAAQNAKEALQAEMKIMKVQTEQWRKAADAATSLLAGGVDVSRRVSTRCGSMDKHFNGMFETPADGYSGFPKSPEMAEDFDKSGRPKGSGIKMFGDLWRKMK